MPSPCGGWRERGPCRPPTSHRPGRASPRGRYPFLFSWRMLRVCFLRFARGEVVWNAGDADGFGVADAEGGVGTSSSSRSPLRRRKLK